MNQLQPLTPEMYQEYEESLRKHILCVQEAGEKIGVPGLQLVSHDISKRSDEEYLHYVRQFAGPHDDPQGFAKAWLHHIHHNPHHWQHWIFPDNYNLRGGDIVDSCVPIPEHYVLEMIADWMGSSKAYTGSWDMSAWLQKNLRKIKVHPRTLKFIVLTLMDMGYEFGEQMVTFSE